jgi:50S ribosomal protein L16 3-hydroxylase
MVQFTAQVLSRIRWSRSDVVDFLGRYLSAPKPHVVFRPGRGRGPRARLDPKGARVRLDPKTQLLYFGKRFFINGESLAVRHPERLRELADRREADLERLAPLAGLISEWRRAGYLHLTNKEGDG